MESKEVLVEHDLAAVWIELPETGCEGYRTTTVSALVGQGDPDVRWLSRQGGHGFLGTYATVTFTVSPRCLDVTARGTAHGSKVQLWSSGGGTHQKWSVSSAG